MLIVILKARLIRFSYLLLLGLSFCLSGVNVYAAGEADVVKVDARQTAPEIWRFSVTVLHQDSGWEKYADGWDVVLPNGSVVKPAPNEEFTRTLWHPHVNEQPFTRSQGGIKIPASVQSVTVRAHVKPDGFGGKEMRVELKGDQGKR